MSRTRKTIKKKILKTAVDVVDTTLPVLRDGINQIVTGITKDLENKLRRKIKRKLFKKSEVKSKRG